MTFSPRARLTKVLIAINVVAFIWEYFTGALNSNVALVADGAFYGPYVAQGQWWRLVTGAFLHGSLLHILFNMIALYQLGTFVETIFGTPKMALIYAISLAGGAVGVYYFSFNDVTIGASGAIFGLFGAILAVGLRLGARGRGLLRDTAPIVVINLVLGFVVPNISVAAHLGGLFLGFIAGFALWSAPAAVEARGVEEAPLQTLEAAMVGNEAVVIDGEGRPHIEHTDKPPSHEPR